ncbi:hypothetical protein HZH68_001134 [Vespula germanica]|uniref:Uncharacterized protein n=1 Tax=Vespula germanica TaxID=30212 RepID=A0A834NUY8_VESGE|nr:hypothetical protein HZH68_001134 [Vespula germanica]
MSSTLFLDMRREIMKDRSRTWSLGQRRANIPGQTRVKAFSDIKHRLNVNCEVDEIEFRLGKCDTTMP